MALIDAFGCVLAVEVQARIDMPPFAQSAMDGYALGEGPADQGSTFNVIGEVAAGSSRQFQLKKGECVRIFTGAPVPETAKTVVQQEWVERNNDRIVLQREVPDKMHIRPIGEQIKANDIALPKGTLLNPAAIGFLQMLGIAEVEVFTKPNVKVLVTGNELVEVGDSLQYGQIYESNAQMLLAALRKEGIEGHAGRVKDDLSQTI
ncbi:MAG: molybdopterin molybdotransferase MoeA, partial [Flavobacteriales bacterium]|nr:molybdopterin molybdotransferase MoeA [Flavobacteriales bacterium]